MSKGGLDLRKIYNEWNRPNKKPSPMAGIKDVLIKQIQKDARSKRNDSKRKRRSEPLTQKAEQDGIAGSLSHFNHGTWKLSIPRSVLRDLCKNYNVKNGALSIASTPGLQSVYDIQSFFSSADILGLSGLATATNGKILCNAVRAKTIFTNASNTTAYLSIYDVTLRRDLNNSTIMGPTTAWKQGVTDEGGGATSYEFLNSTPFSSKSFTQFFVIKKITTVTLGQGETHVHSVYFRPNKAIDYGVAEYGSLWKGLTCQQMVIQHGQASDAVTGLAGVSVGNSKVNIVWSKEYESSYIADQTTTWSGSNSLPVTFAGGENTISIGAGLVEAQTTA